MVRLKIKAIIFNYKFQLRQNGRNSSGRKYRPKLSRSIPHFYWLRLLARNPTKMCVIDFRWTYGMYLFIFSFIFVAAMCYRGLPCDRKVHFSSGDVVQQRWSASLLYFSNWFYKKKKKKRSPNHWLTYWNFFKFSWFSWWNFFKFSWFNPSIRIIITYSYSF